MNMRRVILGTLVLPFFGIGQAIAGTVVFSSPTNPANDSLLGDVSLTDSSRSHQVNVISSDSNFAARGIGDSTSFSYRVAAQASTDSSFLSTPDSIYLTGSVSLGYTLPTGPTDNALWDIVTDAEYRGVAAVDGSSGVATANTLNITSAGTASGIGFGLTGVSLSGGTYNFDTTGTDQVTNTTPGGGTVNANISLYSQTSNSTTESFVGLGQYSSMSSFNLDNTVYPSGAVANADGVFVTVTLTPHLNFSGQTLNGPVALASTEHLSGFGTVNGDISGSGSITPSGTGLTLGNAASSTGVDYSGSMTVGSSNVTLQDSDHALLGGTTTLNGGTLNAANGLEMVAAGLLNGTGLVNANVINKADVAPGASAGTLNINGDFTQDPVGTLFIELGGLAAGTDYDVLDISGNAALGGALDVSLIGGFSPNLGDSFDILLANAVSGGFSNVILPTLAGGLHFDVVYDTNKVTLSAVPLPPAIWLFASSLLGLLALSRRRVCAAA